MHCAGIFAEPSQPMLRMPALFNILNRTVLGHPKDPAKKRSRDDQQRLSKNTCGKGSTSIHLSISAPRTHALRISADLCGPAAGPVPRLHSATAAANAFLSASSASFSCARACTNALCSCDAAAFAQVRHTYIADHRCRLIAVSQAARAHHHTLSQHKLRIRKSETQSTVPVEVQGALNGLLQTRSGR